MDCLQFNIFVVENHQGSWREGGKGYSPLQCGHAILWIQLGFRKLYKK